MRGALEGIVAACVALLAAAILLQAAVGILERIWPWLLGIGTVVILIAGVVAWVVWRRRQW